MTDIQLPDWGSIDEYNTAQAQKMEVFKPFFNERETLELLHNKKSRLFILRHGNLLYKYYRISDPKRLKRSYWTHENEAMLRLNGMSAPMIYGYLSRTCGNRQEIILCRDYLEGDHVHDITDETLEPFCRMITDLHQASISTEDPVLNNFIHHADQLIMIDLDQSKTHQPGSAAAAFFMGKELANIRLKVINKNRKLWKRFKQEYHNKMKWGIFKRMLLHMGYWWWYIKKMPKYVIPVWFGKGYREEGRSRINADDE